MRQTLRPYQADALARVVTAFNNGARRVLLVLPTGGGKTTIFASLIEQWRCGAVVLVHRRELAFQASARLTEFDVDHGLVMSGLPRKALARVQVAMVQTAVRRDLPPADVLVADEAHLSTADTWAKVMSAYPNARVLGVTASPWRLGGAPLSGTYDALVVGAVPAQLCADGYLAPYQGFAYRAPDLSDVKRQRGEFHEGQASAAMRAPGIVANIVEQWQAHASHLSTVVFAVTVEHSRDLTAQFKTAGVAAEHLDGGTTPHARAAILARVASGETRVLCNVGVAVEGLDIPRLKCCVLARPTLSLTRALQMMGRVRRPWQGQTARIHDHAFVIPTHGLPDSPRDYSLGASVKETAEALPSLTTCPDCFAMYEGASCPACGVAAPPVERIIREVDDAEQYGFESGDHAAGIEFPALRATDLPPVRIRWDRTGRVVEGVYRGSSVETVTWGKQRVHSIEGVGRVYSCPGARKLDMMLQRAKVGDRVRVTYKGRSESGGQKASHEFGVAIDSA